MSLDSIPPEGAAEAAISRVLAAESGAKKTVAQAAQDADELDERSRAQARALAERTERRIRAVRGAFEAHVGAEIAAIEGQASASDASQPLSPEDSLRLERALSSLAAELTGDAS